MRGPSLCRDAENSAEFFAAPYATPIPQPGPQSARHRHTTGAIATVGAVRPHKAHRPGVEPGTPPIGRCLTRGNAPPAPLPVQTADGSRSLLRGAADVASKPAPPLWRRHGRPRGDTRRRHSCHEGPAADICFSSAPAFVDATAIGASCVAFAARSCVRPPLVVSLPTTSTTTTRSNSRVVISRPMATFRDSVFLRAGSYIAWP